MSCCTPADLRTAVSSERALHKTAFLSHLYMKTIILPRQARDKQRENSTKKDGVIRTEDAHTVDTNPLIAEHLSKVKVIRNRPLRKTVVFFECFPYVCPEPVLVK
jgi:hypothetical protein